VKFAGLLAVAAVILAGCGGGSSHANQRRDAINTYFDRLDRAQRSLVSSAGEIDSAFHNFQLNGNSAKELHELAFARERVGAALQRVRAIDAPPEARHLRTDLVRMLTLEHAAADELLRIAVYEPQLTRALAPLSPAGKTLATDIRQAAKTQTPAVAVSAADKAAGAIWGKAGCGGCHTLAATGSAGTTGPNLDVLRLSAAEIAAQVRTGGGGMPSFAKSLAPAQISSLASFVSTAESHDAANSAVLDAYASAFNRYRDSLDGVLKALDRLNAPPLLQPSRQAELSTLRRASTLSGSVGAALTRRDVVAANRGIRQLFASAASAGQASTQRAVVAAVRAYNGRLRLISTLTANVARERQRLVQQFG
jgi:mono/diheme cytochrome c family protein